MKKDLNGVRVGVDGNGDGRRGADIGAYEAKAKGHRGGKGHQGGKGGKAARARATTRLPTTAARPITARTGNGGKNHRLAYRT